MVLAAWRRLVDRLVADDFLGIRYAVLIFVASTILWMILELGANTNPVWAISSMVAIVDPHLRAALATFHGRIINTMIGCALGLAVLAIGGETPWKLPLVLALAVLLSSYLLHVESSWRMAPTNAAFVIATELTRHSSVGAMEAGLKRTGEVILGCLVGLAISWLFARIWPMREPAKPTPAPAKG